MVRRLSRCCTRPDSGSGYEAEPARAEKRGLRQTEEDSGAEARGASVAGLGTRRSVFRAVCNADVA